MSTVDDVAVARRDASRRRIALSLCAEWRMIASVSLRPCHDSEGFHAEITLDPAMVRGSYEQQGYPRTRAAMDKVEARRRFALEECLSSVNRRLPAVEQIKSFSVVG